MQLVSLGLLTLYMFRTRFVSIFRSRYTNCRCSHQCVSMGVGWYVYVETGYGVHEDDDVYWSSLLHHISTF